MRKRYFLVFASPIFAISIEAQTVQDLPETVVTEAPQIYAVQGNVATNSALQESEMERAIRRARDEKALKNAMAAQTMQPQVYTSPDQLIQAERPSSTPPRTTPDGTEALSASTFLPNGINRPITPQVQEDVPAFLPVPEIQYSDNGPSDAQSVLDRVNSGGGNQPNPYLGDPGVTDAQRDEATQGAVASPGNSQKSGLFSKLFGKEETAGEMSVPPSSFQAPASPATYEQPTLPPEPAPVPAPAPVVTSAPAPAPAPAPSGPDLFQRKAAASSAGGDSATVTTQVQAEVAGVLVTLFEGSKVTILSESGSTARVQLPDSRIGTVDSSALAR